MSATGFNEMRAMCPNESSVPALGLAWSHCVNTRIQLVRDTCFSRSAREVSSDDASLEHGTTVPSALSSAVSMGYHTSVGAGVRATDAFSRIDSDMRTTRQISGSVVANAAPSTTTTTSNAVRCTAHPQSFSARKMVLQQSPLRPEAECYFEIHANGIFGMM